MSPTLLVQTVTPAADERAARRELRRQIARLEARGATTPAAASGPRLLSLAELESLRDALLASRTSAIPPPAAESATFAAARLPLERMHADPRRHRHDAVSLNDMGLPGCGTYRVKPRLGVIGRLAGWWQITLSSGCP